MSTEIDKRIVEMQFENEHFERNINTTIKSLQDLDRGLELDKASRSLRDFQRAAKEFDLSNVATQIAGALTGFESLLRIKVITGVIDSALGTLKNTIKGLTVDQLSAGWGKYEEKVSAVQTIMSATGKSIDEVNAQMERLLWFTDETSYSFADMTNNIGKFTSQGVDLETATSVMMGISDWAAASGRGTQQASMAMYNLAQTLGAGYVDYANWKSIVNANMDTMEFKQTVLDTAVAMGKLRKEGEDLYSFTEGKSGSFGINELFGSDKDAGLSTARWFTSDILVETLKEYSEWGDEVYELTQQGYSTTEAMNKLGKSTKSLGEKAFRAAQEAKSLTDVIAAIKDAVSTGWMQTYEKIFGNYEEAKVFWTEIANLAWELFNGGSEGRLELFEEAPEAMELFRDSIRLVIVAAQEMKDRVVAAFEQIFGVMTPEDLTNVARFVHSMVQALTMYGSSGEQAKKTATVLGALTRTVHLLFYALKTVILTAVGLGKVLYSALAEPLIAVMHLIGTLARDLTKIFADNNFAEAIYGSLSVLADKVKPIAKAIAEDIYALSDLLSGLYKIAVKEITVMASALSKLFSKLDSSIDLTGVTDTLSWFISKLRISSWDIKGILESLENFFDAINNLSFGFDTSEVSKETSILSKTLSALKKFGDILLKIFTKIGNAVKSVFSDILSLKDELKLDKIKKTVSGLGETINDVFDPTKAKGTYWEQRLAELGDAVKHFNFGSLGKIKAEFEAFDRDITKKLTFSDILEGSLAAGLVVGFLKVFDKIKEAVEMLGGKKSAKTEIIKTIDAIKDTVEGFNDTIGSVGDAIEAFQKKVQSEIIKNIAQSLVMMAAACFVLSLIDPTNIGTILGTITISLVELLGAMKFISGMDVLDKAGLASLAAMTSVIRSLSITLLIMSIAMAALSKADPANLESAMQSMLAILASLVAVMAFLRKFTPEQAEVIKPLVKAMKTLANVIFELGLVVLILSAIPEEKMATSIAGMASIMGALVFFTKSIGKMDAEPDKVAKLMGSVILLAVAINLMMVPILTLSLIPVDMLTKGIIALYAILVGLIALTGFFALIEKTYNGSADAILQMSEALVLIALSIDMLLPAILLFSLMPIDKLNQGFGGMIIMLAEILGAILALALISKLVTNGADDMIKLSACMLILSIAIEALLPAIIAMSYIPWDDHLSVALMSLGIVLLEVLVTIALMAVIADKLLKGGVNDMLTLSFAFVIIAKAIESLTLTLVALAAFGSDGILAATALGIILAVVAGLIAVLAWASNILKDPKQLIVLAIALNAIVYAVGQLALPLMGMAAMGSNIWDAVGAMVVMMLTLTVMIAALMALSKYLGDPKALITLGIGMILIAGAIMMISSSMIAMAAVGDALDKPFLKIVILMGVFTLMMAILSKVGKGAIPVLLSVAGAVLAVGVAIGIAALSIGGMVWMIGEGIYLAVTAIIEFMMAMALLGPMIPTICDNIINNKDRMKAAVKALLEVVIQAIIDSMDQILQLAKALLNGIVVLLRDQIPVFIQGLLEAIVLILYTLTMQIGPIIQVLGLLVWEVVKALVGLLVNLADYICRGIVMLLKGVLKLLYTYVPELLDICVEFVKAFFYMLGYALWSGGVAIVSIFTGLFEGIKAGMEGKPMEELVDSFADMFDIESPSKVMEENGEFLMEGLTNGINNSMSDPLAAMSNMGAGMDDILGGIGGTLGDGLPSSISLPNLNLGGNYAQPTNMASVPSYAKKYAAVTPISTSASVTPVLDMNSLMGMNGMDLGSFTGSGTFDLGTNFDMSAMTSSFSQSNENQTEKLLDPLDKTADGISLLNSKFDTLSSELANQNTSIYLDTGVLVGEMAPGIDAELGKNYATSARGSMHF